MIGLKYPTVTPGRDLFNCSPAQFDQFTEVDKAKPRFGLMQDAALRLGLTLVPRDGLWYLTDADGNVVTPPSRSPRGAIVAWWEETGLKQVIEQRQQGHEWENFRSQGRVAVPDDQRRDTRPAIRETSYRILEKIWNEACELLLSHTAQSEVWMKLAVARDMPRQHRVNRVGERRALVDAVCSLYDTAGLNKEIAALLDGGVAEDEVISENLLRDLSQLACDGHAAGVMPRMALVAAVQLSPSPALSIYHELHELLVKNEVANRHELAVLADMVLS